MGRGVRHNWSGRSGRSRKESPGAVPGLETSAEAFFLSSDYLHSVGTYLARTGVPAGGLTASLRLVAVTLVEDAHAQSTLPGTAPSGPPCTPGVKVRITPVWSCGMPFAVLL